MFSAEEWTIPTRRCWCTSACTWEKSCWNMGASSATLPTFILSLTSECELLLFFLFCLKTLRTFSMTGYLRLTKNIGIHFVTQKTISRLPLVEIAHWFSFIFHPRARFTSCCSNSLKRWKNASHNLCFVNVYIENMLRGRFCLLVRLQVWELVLIWSVNGTALSLPDHCFSLHRHANLCIRVSF